jgi:hypothetical protein
MNKALKTTSYLNSETGEYKEHKSWVDMQFNDDGYLMQPNKNSVRMFLDSPLPNELTWAEQGRLIKLQHYILRENQLLVYRSHGALSPVDIPEMCKILDMSTRQCKGLMNKSRVLSIIKEIQLDETRYFMFNPIYGIKGKRLGLTVYLTFQEELKAVLPKWVIDRFLVQAQEISPDIKIVK